MASFFLTINRSTTAEPTCTRAHFHTSGSNQIQQATSTIWRQWTVVLWKCLSHTLKCFFLGGGVINGNVSQTNNNRILIKMQLDATVSRCLFTAKSLYMFRVSQHPSSGVLKTVPAASGTGHNIGAATSLPRGQIGTGLCESSPDLAMLEGSSCTDIMTCTGGCGYSF